MLTDVFSLCWLYPKVKRWNRLILPLIPQSIQVTLHLFLALGLSGQCSGPYSWVID